jgi:cation diffusion facilitator CzcD-associated flavoprotein CzcO
MDAFAGDVLHSSEYRNGDRWAGRRVLIVGFGNSACEQALDLVERGVEAHLSVRSAVNVIPRDVFGVVPVLQLGIALKRLPPRIADAIAWPVVRLAVGDIREAGLRKLPFGPITQIDRYGRVPLLDIGTMREIRAGRIDVHPGIERFTEEGVELVDGTRLAVDAVVLATGFAAKVDDFLDGWEDVCDPQGTPLRSGGEGDRGLFFCGMWVSPAGMLREIGIEARQIAYAISAG